MAAAGAIYVYGYAVAQLLALAASARYRQIGEAFVDDYLAMFAAGGSRDPHQLAAMIGVDLSDPGLWNLGLDLIDARLREAETLADVGAKRNSATVNASLRLDSAVGQTSRQRTRGVTLGRRTPTVVSSRRTDVAARATECRCGSHQMPCEGVLRGCAQSSPPVSRWPWLGVATAHAQTFAPDYFGISGGFDPSDTAALATVNTEGIGVLRMDAPWASAEPTAPAAGQPATYTWTGLDATATALAQQGIRWYPILDAPPTWDSPVPSGSVWGVPDTAGFAA